MSKKLAIKEELLRKIQKIKGDLKHYYIHHPDYIMVLHLQLARAYIDLSEIQEKEQNLNLAIETFIQAREKLFINFNPTFYFQVNFILGTAYGQLSEIRDREKNLKNAIEAFKEALEFSEYEKYSEEWKSIIRESIQAILSYPVIHEYVRTQFIIGKIYSNLAELKDKKENFIKAINALKDASKNYTYETDLKLLSAVQIQLGFAFFKLSEIQDDEKNIYHAFKAFVKALMYNRPKQDQDQCYRIKKNLQETYLNFAKIKDNKENLKELIEKIVTESIIEEFFTLFSFFIIKKTEY